MLERRGGHVVNISSGLGYTPTASESGYVTTKAAVLALLGDSWDRGRARVVSASVHATRRSARHGASWGVAPAERLWTESERLLTSVGFEPPRVPLLDVVRSRQAFGRGLRLDK